MGDIATDGYTQAGANFVYSASGLWYFLQHAQAGELYVYSANETKATGFFRPTYDGDIRITTAPRVQVTAVTNPSGAFWVSASGVDQFEVTFATAPFGTGQSTFPLRVANWLALL